LGPHDDVSVAPLEPLEVDVAEVAEVAEAELLLAPAPGALLVVLLLLPQPVIATTPAIAAQGETNSETHRDLLRLTGELRIPATATLCGNPYWCQDLVRNC
jgi:hypothetical protein